MDKVTIKRGKRVCLFIHNVTRFKSQIDHTIWFDIPFAYDPFWIGIESKKEIDKTINE